MTDRYFALTVTLDQNVRDDDAEAIIAAIRQLRHVLDVTPHVANTETHMAEVRAKAELQTKLWEALR